MGIIASNAYLATFGAGTLIGGTALYIWLRIRDVIPSATPIEERYKVRTDNSRFALNKM